MRWSEEQLAEHLEKRGIRGAPNRTDVSQPPFALTQMTLDLPAPISVNRSRRIDWKAHKKVQAWQEMADRFLEVAIARGEVQTAQVASYELHIVLSEDHCRTDIDNGLKLVIDYLRHRGITSDDGKKQLRRLLVEWGNAPAGVKIIVRPLR